MIRLHRIRTATAVPAGFRGEGKKAKEKKLLTARRDHLLRLQSDPKAGHGYSSAWWKGAKTQLRKESQGKCAYCEVRADAVAHCDVEHFRPKSIWWWLTCCWDNYLFACQLCNQEYKSDRFPFRGTAAAPVALEAGTDDVSLDGFSGRLAPDPLLTEEITAWLTGIGTELSDLPDPYVQDPEAFLAWKVDDDAAEITVIPRAETEETRRVVDACIATFGLNRDELRQLRYEVFEGLDSTREALRQEGIPEASRTKLLKRLERFVAPKHQFAGMCRYFLIDLWELLPPEARS